MTPARGAGAGLFADRLTRAKGEAAQEAGVSAGVIDGLIDEGTLETVVLPPEKVTQPPDPDFRKPEFALDAIGRRRRAAHHRRSGRLHRHAARRRHRLRQDGSLFRGRRRKYPARPADADPDAGNRAHRASRSTASPRASARVRRNGIRNCRRARARAPGRRWRPTKCRWWSARARRCFCLMPISA